MCRQLRFITWIKSYKIWITLFVFKWLYCVKLPRSWRWQPRTRVSVILPGFKQQSVLLYTVCTLFYHLFILLSLILLIILFYLVVVWICFSRSIILFFLQFFFIFFVYNITLIFQVCMIFGIMSAVCLSVGTSIYILHFIHLEFFFIKTNKHKKYYYKK